jgi:hypothetical protein
MNEAFILSGVYHEINTLLDETNLKFDEALHILGEAQASIARGAQEEFHVL